MEKKFEFTPKQWVLIRPKNGINQWTLGQMSHDSSDFYNLTNLINLRKDTFDVIPYDRNEHLLGTTKDYEEPYEPKRGDFVVVTNRVGKGKWIAIYDQKITSVEFNAFVYLNLGEIYYSQELWNYYIRPATDEEKQLLLDEMHREGVDWDAEKMEVVEYKWKAEIGKPFYRPKYIEQGGGMFVTGGYLINDKSDRKEGWDFRTIEECDKFCDKLNEAIKNVK